MRALLASGSWCERSCASSGEVLSAPERMEERTHVLNKERIRDGLLPQTE
jgi:hypothetical protein